MEAVQILNAHRDQVIEVMSSFGYTDPKRLGGYLDRDLSARASASSAFTLDLRSQCRSLSLRGISSFAIKPVQPV